MSRKNSERAELKRQRLNRLPRGVQRMIADRCTMQKILVGAPFARLMFAAGHSPTPGMGVAEFDAYISLMKDALGLAALSDGEFEHALRLMIPPECRETSQ
jgi:hypothetical protein